MTQLLLDEFTGAEGDTLNTYNPAWVRLGTTGSTVLSAGRAKHNSTSTAALYYRSDVVPPSADYSVTADLISATSVAGAAMGPMGRVSSTGINFYWARVNTTNGVSLIRYVGGTATSLATTPYTFVTGSTVKVRLEMIGSTISVYVDDVLQVTVEDTSHTAPGYVGMRSINASTQLFLDNLRADTIAAGGALSYSFIPAGGLVLAGAAARIASRGASPAGGLLFSGVGASMRGRVRAAAGGLTLSGASSSIRSRLRTVAGGLILSGAAAIAQTSAVQARVVAAVGGVVLAGAATVRRGVGRATAGGLSFAGAAGLAFASVFRRALVLIGVTLRQVRDNELSTGQRPIVLVAGRLRRQQASEGTPLVLDNGEVRPLAADETLKI
jgi:hypothetical protein